MSAKATTGVVVLVLSVGLGIGMVVRSQSAQRNADLTDVKMAIESAEALLRTARAENLIVLAQSEFDVAAGLLGQAKSSLGASVVKRARQEADSAHESMQSAVELARKRQPTKSAATIGEVRNEVLYRRADAVAWVDATTAMNLYDRDRLATKAHSEVLVRFSRGSEMRLEQNSVLVVEHLADDQSSLTKDVKLRVDEGGFRSVLTRSAGQDVRMSINLPKARVLVDTAGLGAGHAEIGAQVSDDQTNRVAVYSGEVELVADDGERVVVQQNELAEVAADGRLQGVRALPASVQVIAPKTGERVYISARRSDVTFRWKPAAECKSYVLEIGSKDELDKLSVDGNRLDGNRFAATGNRSSVADLAPGQYHWRVSCIDEKGVGGVSGPATPFVVARDDEPPRLSVLEPQENAVVDGAELKAFCRTEPLAAVFINGSEAEGAGSGLFTRQVALQLGVNTLIFEAIDEAGNVVYNSRLVTRRR